MRGGKRTGAGRKPSEPTKMIRVPVSMIPEIQALIARRRASLNPDTEIKSAAVEAPLISESENKVSEPEISLFVESEIKPIEIQAAFDKQALRNLERVPKSIQRELRDKFGSLAGAVKAGVRAERSDGKWIAAQWG
jgi:hypothetical protein